MNYKIYFKSIGQYIAFTGTEEEAKEKEIQLNPFLGYSERKKNILVQVVDYKSL